MYSSRLFWKLLLASAGLSLVALVSFGLILSDQLQDQLVQQVDRRLRDSAELLRGELTEQVQLSPKEATQQRVRRLSKETQTRYTLIAADGTVLADSDASSADVVKMMDNHRDRPEVVEARTHGSGNSIRSSKTVGSPHRYYTVRIDVDGEPVGYVRSSVSMADVVEQTAALRRRTWGLLSIICLFLVAALYWALSRLLRPMRVLMRAADSIAKGDYSHRWYVARHDEFGTLATTLSRISQDLHTRTTQIGRTLGQQSTVLGGMIEGVIAVDDRQRIVLANNAAGRLFQFPAAIAEGRPLLEIVRNHSVYDAAKHALATGLPQRVETNSSVMVPSAGGQRTAMRGATDAGQMPPGGRPTLNVDVHVQPLPGNPCPGVVLVMHDTTELRRLESLRRDFIANVSHELKTPLASIKAYTETLSNGALHDKDTAQKFLGRIEEQSERLHRLINDMLMLARIESEQQPFEIVSIDLPPAVAACLDDHRAAAQAKRIELDVASDLAPCRVKADREGLREVLNNLIDNAIKYTPDGGNVVVGWSEKQGTTSEEDATSEGACRAVCLYVRDTGIGIKPKDQERVFERFYRVDRARSREMGGTGLGLAIVKHLAQSFGGTVSVTSDGEQGSTFTVELPSG